MSASTTLRAVIAAAVVLCACGPRGDRTTGPQATGPRWLRAVGGDGHTAVRAVALDDAGEVVAAGSFEGALDGTDSAGSSDAFVRRFDASGAPRWTIAIGGEGPDHARAVALLAGGDVIAGGAFTRHATAGDAALRGRGRPDGFVARLGAGDGAVAWTRVLAATEYVHVAAVAAHGDLVVVGGLFGGTLRAGDEVLTSAGVADGFVVALDDRGGVRWARRVGGNGADAIHGVAAGEHGIAIGGAFSEVAGVGGIELVATETRFPQQDAFVALLGGDGAVRWATGFGGQGPDAVFGVAFTGERIAVCGNVAATATVGDRELTARGFGDALVAAFDLDGTPRWALSLGGAGNDEAHRIAAGGDRLVVGGTYEGEAVAGSRDLDSRGRHDIFLVTVAEDGTVADATSWGGGGQDALEGLATAASGVVAGGSFAGSASFDGERAAATGPSSGFVFKR